MKKETLVEINRYVNDGLPPGSFLTAVLSNDLMGALGLADQENRRDIFEICQYVYNDLPYQCHGSREKVKAWTKSVIDGKNATQERGDINGDN